MGVTKQIIKHSLFGITIIHKLWRLWFRSFKTVNILQTNFASYYKTKPANIMGVVFSSALLTKRLELFGLICLWFSLANDNGGTAFLVNQYINKIPLIGAFQTPPSNGSTNTQWSPDCFLCMRDLYLFYTPVRGAQVGLYLPGRDGNLRTFEIFLTH